MIRKFKVFSLAAVMALALTAVAASAAQAAPLFHTETAPATITGSQIGEQIFTTKEGTVTCKKATFTGTSSVTTTAVQDLAPKYEECTAFGFIGASVTAEGGCVYRFTLVEGSSPPTAKVNVCPTGGQVKVVGGFCTMTIGNSGNTSLSHIVFSNEGSKTTRDIKANVTVEGVTYTAGSGCVEPGTFSDGKLTGEATIKADNSSGTQQGLWVE